MNRILVLCGLVLGLGVGGNLRAERTSTRLTPGKTEDQFWKFTVKVEKLRSEGHPAVLQFTVTAAPVKPNQPRLPDRIAMLEVRDGKTYVSDARLTAKTQGETATYVFRAAETHAAKSTFVFGETDEARLEGMGAFYFFFLADFVPAKEPAPKANEREKSKEAEQPKAPLTKLEDVWEVAKFPKLTGKLTRYIGRGNTFVHPKDGDTLDLDFAGIGKLEHLRFGTGDKARQPVLALPGPLQLAHVNTFTTGAFASCRFTARHRDSATHIDIHPKPGRGDPRFVELIMTQERNGLVTFAGLVECLADGEFPPPAKTPKAGE